MEACLMSWNQESGHDSYLKYPGLRPVCFLKAAYMAERDWKPDSMPMPSTDKWLKAGSFNMFRAAATLKPLTHSAKLFLKFWLIQPEISRGDMSMARERSYRVRLCRRYNLRDSIKEVSSLPSS